MPTITDQEYQKGYKIIGSDVVDDKGGVVRTEGAAAPGNTAPGSTDQQTPPGSLGGSLPPTNGSIFDYQTVIRQALNEASTQRKNQQMGSIAPFTAGLPNNALTSVISSIKQGANLDATGTYKSFLDSQETERQLQQQKEKNTLDIVKAMADDGSLGDLPDGALLALAKTSGLDAGQLLSWRQGVKSKNELTQKKTLAEIEQIKSATAENYAQARAAGQQNTYQNNKPLTITDLKKYNLPSSLTQGKLKYLTDNLQEATAGVKLTDANRYELWGKTAEWVDAQHNDSTSPLYGYTASDFDALLWEKFHPEGLAGWNKQNGKKTAAQVNSGTDLEQLGTLLNNLPTKPK